MQAGYGGFLGNRSILVLNRQSLRMLLVALLAALFVAATTGLVGRHVFHQASSLKYDLTVAGALIALLALLDRRPARIAIWVLVLAAPFAPYVITIHGQAVSALLAATVFAVVVVLAEGPVDDGRHRRSSLATAAPWILLLLAIPAVLSANPQTKIVYLLTPVVLGWVVFRVCRLYPDGKDVVVWALLGSASLQSALSLVQRSTGHATNLYGQGTASYSSSYFFNYGKVARTTGAFFDPISLGNVLAAALPFALLMAIRRDQQFGRRVAAMGLCLLLGAGLAVSFSRESWIAAAAGCVLVALTSPRGQRRRGVALVSVLLVGAGALAVSLDGAAISSRFTSIIHPDTVKASSGDTNSERISIWSEAVGTFEKNPLVGVGLGDFTTYQSSLSPATPLSGDTQNVYLQYLAEAGLLGGVSLGLLLIGVAADVVAAGSKDPVRPALVGSVVAIAICWITDVTVNYTAVEASVAIVLGLVVAAGSRPASRAPVSLTGES